MATARPRLIERFTEPITADFGAEVRAGLTKSGQKELPSKFLYDEIGSELFEVICLLPEYGLSRAGARLLRQHASEIIDRLPLPIVVAELGSGSGSKTRWILEALAARQPVKYFPIDISRMALSRCWQELGHLDSVSVVGFERAYLDGLLEVAARRESGERLLVLFLGSTIGNFDRPAGEDFLRAVRRVLRPGDALLLATDLEKPVDQLIAAYDDSTGVTAAFNLNILAHVNRETGADFQLRQFEHSVRWDESDRRIEMHLRSRVDQTVLVRNGGFACHLRAGETIWTESSHKYNCSEVVAMGERAGYRCDSQWVDAEWPFAQSLFIAV
jgi:L-histidine Nalpha-methyltransferase